MNKNFCQGRTDLVGEKLGIAQACCTAHVTEMPEVHGRCFLSVEQRNSRSGTLLSSLYMNKPRRTTNW